MGCSGVNTNLKLLETTRAQNPDAVLIFKPHPDVEAGLRKGAVSQEDALKHADLVLECIDAAATLPRVQAVWTMTSLIGFEALMRNIPVTTLGAPFYAGWGLTDDRGETPERRTARPSLAGFVHSALIDYPRYYDPVTKQPCPVEVIVERLSNDEISMPGLLNRILAKLQGHFAGLRQFSR
jgi:capsular polysaccharide export protein